MYQFSQKYLLVNTTKSPALPAGKYPVVGAMAPRQDKTSKWPPCTTRSAEMSKIPRLLMVGG